MVAKEKKNTYDPWLARLTWLNVVLQTKMSWSFTPGQGTCLGYGVSSQLGVCRRQPSMFYTYIDLSLPPFFPSFSLESIK